jgi:hypothetical protein
MAVSECEWLWLLAVAVDGCGCCGAVVAVAIYSFFVVAFFIIKLCKFA